MLRPFGGSRLWPSPSLLTGQACSLLRRAQSGVDHLLCRLWGYVFAGLIPVLRQVVVIHPLAREVLTHSRRFLFTIHPMSHAPTVRGCSADEKSKNCFSYSQGYPNSADLKDQGGSDIPKERVAASWSSRGYAT